MEASTTTTTRKRKPLADRTNTTSLPSSNSISTRSLHKLPPPPPPPPIPLSTISNSTSTTTAAAAAAAAASVSSKSSNQQTKKNDKQQLVGISSIETRSTKRRKLAHSSIVSRSVDYDANKENIPVDDVNYTNFNFDILPNVSTSSSPFTPSVRQQLSPIAEPLTVYARRQTTKKKGKEKVVSEAFTCLHVERKRTKSNKGDVAKISKSLTDPPKKRRNKERVVSNDYFEKQKAYFAEIDKCELPEEEVSENELSDL